MSRISDRYQDSVPQFFVVLLPDGELGAAVAELPQEIRVVGRGELRDAVSVEVGYRSSVEASTIGDLEQELRSVMNRRAASEVAHADLLLEQSRTREAAHWCDAQPAQEIADVGEIASSAETLESHSRIVREANRQLERVLEQRAASEAALEDARAELASLAAAGHDETDVRRQLETASRAMHGATAEYQACMTEVARSKAEVWELEDAMTISDAPPPSGTTDGSRRDPLRSMRAAVNAKLTPGEADPTALDPDALDRARRAAAEAERRADDVSAELADARATLTALEHELTVRTHESDSREERHAAAVELESQVGTVERQLGEAEIRARAEVEDATRSMSRAELALERLRQDVRDRREQLRSYATVMPAEQCPPPEDDPLDHAASIGRALRTHAEAMHPDLEQALDAINRDRATAAGKESALDDRRARIGVPVPEDGTAALAALAQGQLAIAIDDAVTTDDTGRALSDGAVCATSLLDVASSTPLIVLTTDIAVASWAIELPADRAAMTSVADLREIGDLLVEDSTTTP